MDNTFLIAFGLTLFAGLSTGIGSALAFCTKHTNTKFLSIALGFSAGVMIYISFIEMFPAARLYLSRELGATQGYWITVISFFGGIMISAIIDKLVPSFENPHTPHLVEEMDDKNEARKSRKLFRLGTITALAIAIHNFPEGLATFASATQDLSLGIPVAIAVAIHNIPEGISISVPIYHATGSRKKAFTYSFLSGLFEPLGAIVGFTILSNFFNGTTFGILFAMIAGIMVFISLDQLLPAAREYGEHHLSIYGLLAGMVVMAISLLMFA